MADKYELIRGLDGEWRKWRETAPNIYAEEVAVVDGDLTIAGWPVACLEVCHVDDILHALGNPTAGTVAAGTVAIVDLADLTPAGPYQAGDRLTISDGVTAHTFEFYTANAPATGSVGIEEHLAEGDTLTLTEWSGGVSVTFEFVADPPTYAGPNTPVQWVFGDAAATAQYFLLAVQASVLDLTALILAGDLTTVWLINNTEGAGGNVPLTCVVAWPVPEEALEPDGMSGGTDSTLVYVTAGNVPVAAGDSAIVNLETAVNGQAFNVSAALDGATLNLENDNVGTAGNVAITTVVTILGTLAVTGMGGGTNPYAGVLAPATPHNYIVTLVAADTEYQVAIAACHGYEFRARGNVELRYAFATGRVAVPTDPYLTLTAGGQYETTAILLAHTLYLAADVPGTVVELLVYEV